MALTDAQLKEISRKNPAPQATNKYSVDVSGTEGMRESKINDAIDSVKNRLKGRDEAKRDEAKRNNTKDILENRFDTAKDFASSLIPHSKSADVDWPLLSFIYFTNLAAESSKPGATMIGAAGEAAKTPLAYLMKQREQKDTRPKEVRDLTFKLLANEDIWPSRELKTTIRPGELVTYLSPSDAEAKLSSFGLNKNDSNWKSLFDKITKRNKEIKINKFGQVVVSPSNKEVSQKWIDRPVIGSGDKLQRWVIERYPDGSLYDLSIQPMKEGGTPNITKIKNKMIEKLQKVAMAKGNLYSSAIPRINASLTSLLTGELKTGPTQKFLGLKSWASEFASNLKLQGSEKWKKDLYELQDFRSLAYFLAPLMRIEGAGSTSDMEFKAYMDAAANIEKFPEANYISLYALKRYMENDVNINTLRMALWEHSPKPFHDEVEDKINKRDTGIFAKYGSYDENNVFIAGDINNNDAIEKWWIDLPSGTVALNTGWSKTAGLYKIKDWGTQKYVGSRTSTLPRKIAEANLNERRANVRGLQKQTLKEIEKIADDEKNNIISTDYVSYEDAEAIKRQRAINLGRTKELFAADTETLEPRQIYFMEQIIKSVNNYNRSKDENEKEALKSFLMNRLIGHVEPIETIK